MIIKQSTDYALIRRIMTEPQIWQEICGIYGDKIENFEPIVKNYIYLIGYDKMNIIGLFIIHGLGNDFECHIQVIPEHRNKYSEEFGRKVIEWTWENTSINKLKALIPEKFENVISFAKSQGFNVVSVIKGNTIMNIRK